MQNQQPANSVESCALGNTVSELRRLELQASFIRDLTQDVLQRAGLSTGMKVLDLGCGVGDVSLLAGSIVGPSGTVLGIDRSQEAADIANRRRDALRMSWVACERAEIGSYQPAGEFDAIIGRLILMYRPAPAEILKRFSLSLRPGGIVAFQEMSMSQTRSRPEGKTFLECGRLILEAFGRAGFPTDARGV